MFAHEIIKASGVPLAENLEEQSEWGSSKDLSFSPRIGFLGSSLGFSSGAKREKKYRRVVVVAQRTKEKNFEGVLSAAMTTPSILWDNREKRAWLLPVISALAFASLCYIKWQKYTFQKEENGIYEEANVKYCTETKNTGSAAQTFLRRNSFLVVHTA